MWPNFRLYCRFRGRIPGDPRWHARCCPRALDDASVASGSFLLSTWWPGPADPCPEQVLTAAPEPAAAATAERPAHPPGAAAAGARADARRDTSGVPVASPGQASATPAVAPGLPCPPPGGAGGGAAGNTGTGGAGGTLSACQAVLALDCPAPRRRIASVGSHVANCCGTSIALGFRTTVQTQFAALEPLCDMSYPGCGCPPGCR